MITTISYFVAVTLGAQVSPYALIATAFVDFTIAKSFSDWMKSRAMAKTDFVSVAVIETNGDLDEPEDMALDAEEVKEQYG